MVITLCGAVLTPNLNIWRGNTGPVSVKMVGWITGENGPTFSLKEWLGQQKDVLTRVYLPGGCLAWKTLVEGKSLVEESEPQMDLESAQPQGSGSGTVGQGLDIMEMPSSCWVAMVVAWLI